MEKLDEYINGFRAKTVTKKLMQEIAINEKRRDSEIVRFALEKYTQEYFNDKIKKPE
jgi:hypothetical protein